MAIGNISQEQKGAIAGLKNSVVGTGGRQIQGGEIMPRETMSVDDLAKAVIGAQRNPFAVFAKQATAPLLDKSELGKTFVNTPTAGMSSATPTQPTPTATPPQNMADKWFQSSMKRQAWNQIVYTAQTAKSLQRAKRYFDMAFERGVAEGIFSPEDRDTMWAEIEMGFEEPTNPMQNLQEALPAVLLLSLIMRGGGINMNW